jgi:ketosteroid isomerase-like protein
VHEGDIDEGTNPLIELFEAFNGELPASGFEKILDPGIEVVDLPQVPGPRIKQGIDEVEAWIAETKEVWDDLSMELEELLEVESQRWLVRTRLMGRARSSGIEMEQRQSCAVFLRTGRIARMELYAERADAIRSLQS